ncbi:Elongation factor 1-gamma 1 [Nowakowskiella sp. JEL0407]|nr:Elongation factor 1-gamma 1 [Nowakowskiella sp. JEL0407]
MGFGTLYTFPEYDRTSTILIAAKYNKLSIIVKNITRGKENVSPQFLSKFPLGKVPALETSTGFSLYETKAIEYYIASQGTDSSADAVKLLGRSIQDEALITQFITLAENELEPAAAVWLYPLHGWIPANPMFINRAKQDVKKILKILDSHLLTRTYLVGERISLADIAVSMCLKQFFTMVLDLSWRSEFKNLTRWFVTCVNQKEFVVVIGNVKLCEKEMIHPVGGAAKKVVEKRVVSEVTVKSLQKKIVESKSITPSSEFTKWKASIAKSTKEIPLKSLISSAKPINVEYRFQSELDTVKSAAAVIDHLYKSFGGVKDVVVADLSVVGETNFLKVGGAVVCDEKNVSEIIKKLEKDHFAVIDGSKINGKVALKKVFV